MTGSRMHSNHPIEGRRMPKRAPRTSIDTHPIDPTANLLEYRVAVLAVNYAAVHKTRVFGASEVERKAQVSLALRLLNPEGNILWSGEGSAIATDRVPGNRLAEVEDNLYQFPRPLLPSRNVSRILEPAIVVGLVSGLVFLFYTNRN